MYYLTINILIQFKHLFFAGVFMLGYGLVMAQPEIIHFERFSDEEGLPNNLFKQVIQDHTGVLWMAGLDGLASYDGYSVKSFRHSHLDTTTLSGNSISTLFEDSQGRLWIGIKGAGLNVSNKGKSRFYRMKIPVARQLANPLTVTNITEDLVGRIWIGTDYGLFIHHQKEGGYVIEQFIDVFPLVVNMPEVIRTNRLVTDASGKIWIGTESGLFRFDPSEDKLFTPNDFPGLPINAIQDIQFDREGKLWVSCKNSGPRLYYTSLKELRFKPLQGIPFTTSSGDVFFTFDLDNRLWALVFGDQAYGYDLRDSTLFLQSSVNSDIPHERFFRKPFVDHSGNTWLPVEGFYIYPYPKGFRTYIHPYAFHQSNSCIKGFDRILWLGYREKGLVRLDRRTGMTEHFSTMQDDHRKLPVDHIQDVLKVRSGNMIIVGFGNIAVMSPEGKIIADYKVSGTNRAAYEDSKGRVWIGGYFGLYLFSETAGILDTFRLSSGGETEGHLMQTILEDHQGNIWIASDVKGLCKFNPETSELQQFIPVEGDENSLPSVTVVDIALDSQNILWLATDVALVRFDPENYSIATYNRNHGLENDFIAAVVCTPDGLVWMSTHSGISSFDPGLMEFVNYNQSDGLSNFSYYNRGKFYEPDGILYFGGKNGVDYFNPSALRKNLTAPLIRLTAVSVNNKPASIEEIGVEKSAPLQLSYKDKLLEIEMAGPHYADQQQVRYAYKMDGMHDEWIDLGQQRKVLFSGLRPGEYVFRAKAVSGDDVWSTEVLELPILISPPFYGTTWFRILAAGLILAVLIFVVRYRERMIQRKDKLEAEVNRKIVELERRALQAQMNPHFIYNSMNSIQQFMILHDMEGAMKYLTKFSRILRTVLNISAQNRIPLSDEITLITDYLELENMRFPDKFTYEIKVAPEINIHTVEIPPFFIQPQVENAIRHGLLKKETPGHLSISINSDNTHLHITVLDNGIGREAARKAKYQDAVVNESKGLAIVEERLSHLHSPNGFKPFEITDVYDSSGHPAGTRVEIILPLD